MAVRGREASVVEEAVVVGGVVNPPTTTVEIIVLRIKIKTKIQTRLQIQTALQTKVTKEVLNIRTYPKMLGGPVPSIGRKGGLLHTAAILWSVNGSTWWPPDSNEVLASLEKYLKIHQ